VAPLNQPSLRRSLTLGAFALWLRRNDGWFSGATH